MTASSKTNLAIRLVTLFFVTLFVILAMEQLEPPDAASTSVSLTEFSSGRALVHLKVIAQRARPTGSLENARVRGYIVDQLSALGVRPQVQEATAVNPTLVNKFPASAIPAATVKNIVGRLIGTEHTNAVMLVGHYDSVPTAPGASDDSAAVATMLETLRALRAGSPLGRDVIFLFTDGEELGLLGAEAFINEHSWVKDVGIVLNFEGRGNRGPVFMFETSEQNGWLIGEFAHAAPYPVANSLMYSLYRRLPNDTDLTVFKRAGLSGLNFAYAQGLNHYHTLLDNVEEIDERSLQHHGSYALAMTRRYGNLNIGPVRNRDAVYFNIFGRLVHYSEAWVVPLTLLAAALFIGIMILGLTTRQLTVIGIGWGALTLIASAVSASAAVTLIWWIIRRLLPEYQSVAGGDIYSSHLYLLGFVSLTLAITLGIYAWLRRKAAPADLMIGGAFLWLVLLVAFSLALPGGSYLMLWPLLSSLAATGFMMVTRVHEPVSWKHLIVRSLCAIPGIILFVHMFCMLFIMASLQIAGGLMVLIVLLLGLLIPQLNLVSRPGEWWMPAASMLAGFAMIVAGGLTSGFDAHHRKANNIFYVLNADSGKAVWASFDRAPDDWTSQFFTGDVNKIAATELFPWLTQETMQSRAPVAPLAGPNLEVVGEDTQDGVRSVRVRITLLRQARTVYVYADPETEVLGALVNGRRVAGTGTRSPSQSRNPWRLRYSAVPKEGLELTIETKSSQPLKLRVIDVSYALPEIPDVAFRRRPEYMMPTPSYDFSDTTLVAKSFAF